MVDYGIKILIVGNGAYFYYEHALCEAFKEIGYINTELYEYNDYIVKYLDERFKISNIILGKVQNKFSIGPGVKKLNDVLIEKCKKESPEIVFLYRCRAIQPETIRKIKKMGCVIFSYNNDNAFSDYFPKYFWRNYKNSIKLCDMNFVYRKSNIEDCKKSGSKKTEVLRSYYMDSRNFPIKTEEKIKDFPDVVFLGHYENDGRREFLLTLAESGVRIGLPSVWKGKIDSNNIVFLNDTQSQYNRMINSAKIALVFLSTLNHDTYTRRCFEIPATKTMMLSVYTEDLASMFEPEKEAVYFENADSLVGKVKYYLENSESRENIANAGYKRLLRDGHEVKDRAKQILEAYTLIKEEKLEK